MAGSLYTYVGNSESSNRTGAILTSQGTTLKGSSGLFLPNEYAAAVGMGLLLSAGPAISPASQLTAPVVAAGGAGVLTGTFRYVWTFVTAAGETVASPETSITLSSQQASLTNAPLGSAFSGVTARKLYRTAANGASGSEKLVTTLNDNATTFYTDNTADGSLGAVVPTTDTAGVLSSGGSAPSPQTNYAVAGSDGRLGGPGGTPLLTSVISDTLSIDLCRPWGVYAGVTPGSDITSQLQAAYTVAAAAGGGEIYFSVPGNYLLNGGMQAWSAQGASGNAQVLLPAQPMNSPVIAINLKGYKSGSANPGQYNGVTIQSNSTVAGGYMLDVTPGSLVTGQPFSNYNLTFENIGWVTPTNPQIGCVNASCSARYQHKNVMFTALTRGTLASLTGTTPALKMPGVQNSAVSSWEGYTYFDNMPVAWRLGEHGQYFGNIYVGNCLTVMQTSGSVIPNHFHTIHVSNCQTVIDASAVLSATVEGVITWEPGGVTNALFVNDPAHQISGSLQISTSGTTNSVGSLPSIGGLNLNTTYIRNTGPAGQQGQGWMGTHPADTFSRLVAELNASATPGTANTGHPWRVENGGFTRTQVNTTTGRLLSTSAASEARAFLPAKLSAPGRTVTAVFTTSSGSYRPRLRLSRVRGGTANDLIFDFNASTVTFYVNGTQRASGGVLAISTQYTFAAKIINNQANQPQLVKGYLNGALIFVYALSAAEQTALSPGSQWPYVEDGVAFVNDTASFFSSFVVADAVADPPAALITATATRTAWHYERTLCTSGTFTVTLPLPVNGVENVVTNTGTGTITVHPPSGTLANLSGATGDITLAQGASARIVSDGTNYFQV